MSATFWTRDATLDAIRAWHHRTGHAPTWFAWKRAGRGHPCMNTILRLFGSLADAIKEAGLEPERRIDCRWTPEAICAAMLDWVARHGRWPSSWDWNRSGGDVHPPASTVRYVFGSWREAKLAAGWCPNPPAPVVRACSGCGGEFDSFTDGCDTCANRKYTRRIRAAA